VNSREVREPIRGLVDVSAIDGVWELCNNRLISRSAWTYAEDFSLTIQVVHYLLETGMAANLFRDLFTGI